MTKYKANILLVEDDQNLGEILCDFLENEKYRVNLEKDGEKGFIAFKNNSYDICILDIMLPKKDGLTLAKEILHTDPNIPIIFLTAKDQIDDKIKGLKTGADDYITKPFSTEELILRIQAILKRSRINLYAEKIKPVKIGQFRFDFTNQLLISPSKEIKLTKKETELLHMLVIHKNQILSRKVALKSIWGDDDYFMGRSMDVYITKLRKILKEDSNISIMNIHNTGFKLEAKIA